MSFHEKTEELVKKACVFELAQATEKHGLKFNSMHEAWAVLKEEVEETQEEIEYIDLDNLWGFVKRDNIGACMEIVEEIQDCAIKAMMELAQVWAVCEKMKEGVEE